MSITKNKILEHIASGDVDSYLDEVTEGMKPNQSTLVYTQFADLVADLRIEGLIEGYDLTPPFMGTSLPINLKLKR